MAADVVFDGSAARAPVLPAIRIRREVAARALWTCTTVVLALGVFQIVFVEVVGRDTYVGDLRRLALDSELCLPAWYSSLLMATAAFGAMLCGLDARLRDPRNARPWFAVAGIFVYLSLDEMIALHETIVPVMRDAFHPGGFFVFGWVIVGIPAVAIVGLLFLPFIRRLRRPTGTRIVIAGVVFVAGALGMELVGGKVFSLLGRGPVYQAAAFAEEALEMIGLVLFILVLFDHLGRNGPIVVDPAPAGAPRSQS